MTGSVGKTSLLEFIEEHMGMIVKGEIWLFQK